MIHIQKGTSPQALIQAKRAGLTNYDDMDTPTKNAIKEQLLAEQYYLCAYCMRRIDLKSIRIEHYFAQNPQSGNYNAALTIDYQNMLGVCPGGENHAATDKQLTCDRHKKNLLLTINPLDPSLIAKIRYTSDGKIGSDDSNINKDLCETLNLNCPESLLKENRKAALDALKNWVKRQYKGKTVPKAAWEKIYTNLCGEKHGKKQEYVGIIDYYLQGKIKSAH